MTALPIEAIREPFLAALARGPVVVSAPTGSGKSTAVPRWCPGRVVVIEPRRVACQSLARWVAELEGCELGDEVGYAVREERRASESTRILFVTPGIALRRLERLADYDVIIVDELHERGLETDLLLALLRNRAKRLVAMSATLEADRVAGYLGAEHIQGESRTYPVDIRHQAGKSLLPQPKDLTGRVVAALRATEHLAGDALVFLPGKREIAAVSEALRGGSDHVIELYGGLSLDEQNRAFGPAPHGKRKVVLATNVAETSLTIPGIGVVVDSGLVRRARFHKDRGFLTLTPIALDSADQRAGRAGRTSAGVCVRLWSESAKLEAVTPPAVYRESLTPLVLAAAAAGADATELRFLDPPKTYALDAAIAELGALGALDGSGDITDRGRAIFGMPLDPALARLLIEAERTGALEDAIDLAAAVSVNRPFFTGAPESEEDDLRAGGCDAVAVIGAIRSGDARRHGLSRYTLREARHIAKRLRRAFGLPAQRASDLHVDRRRLAETAMAADPRTVHMVRRRKRKLAWSNGGTELELARESAATRKPDTEAIVVLESRAFGLGMRDTRILATCAMPVPIGWLVAAAFGRDRLAGVSFKNKRVVARIERVHARKVIGEREEVPTGALAREAIRDLVLRGSLFKLARDLSRERVTAAALAAGLKLGVEAPPEYGRWLVERLEALGVESGEDVALLSSDDLTFDDVPYEVRHVLDDKYPRHVSVGDASYRVEYDVPKRRVTLHLTKGSRSKPPPISWLPSFAGFHITVEAGGTMHVLR